MKHLSLAGLDLKSKRLLRTLARKLRYRAEPTVLDPLLVRCCLNDCIRVTQTSPEKVGAQIGFTRQAIYDFSSGRRPQAGNQILEALARFLRRRGYPLPVLAPKLRAAKRGQEPIPFPRAIDLKAFQDLPEALREYKRKTGVSQHQIAIRTGLNQMQIHNVLRGAYTNFKPFTVQRIAEFLLRQGYWPRRAA
jgi:hypothetical protein